MDEALRFLRHALELVAGCLLDSLGAPVGAHVGEDLRRVRQQLAEEHAHAVERIVLGGEHVCLARAVPVERRVEHRFGEVAVRVKIRPLALALEAAGDRVVADHLFLAACGQVRVAVVEVLDDAHHLEREGPVLLLLLGGLLQLGGVLVEALGAVLAAPSERALKLRLVVDTVFHAADDLDLIDGFHAHAEVFLEEVGVHDRARDAHADGADL